ncbi:MAG: lysine--tRNA ligase, partial [Verrucomicrobia bacterium]|nr:lysine--tRNA ligase [Verrucomicrobiota bacterium]
NYVEGRRVAVAGRITAHRDMGRSQFMDLRDQSGRIQIYAQKQVLGDAAFRMLKEADLGDFIGVEGPLFTTRTGEVSVKVESFVFLAKALRPPPAKWHGLEDIELRYRRRYLDLMANEETREIFLKRSAIIHEIRQFLHSRGFVEVETPILQAAAGGAAAEPFVTHHKALGRDFYLRIALELHLKRLLVGGFDRVFELGRVFRNEGISRRHNPEFTMLEVYQAYGDYRSMMELLESMVCHVAKTVLGGLKIDHKDEEGNVIRTIDLTPPWRRVPFKDLVKEEVRKRTGIEDWFALNPAQRRKTALETLKLEGDIAKGAEDFEVTKAVFEKLIEPTLIQPTFVTHVLREFIPLAKVSAEDPDTIDVYECCINGQEIAPAYSEQNDPIEQRKRLEEQVGEERQNLDEDFLMALEHGMPPAGGLGVGIDRLCMMLLGRPSIRDVILFPQLRPKN